MPAALLTYPDGLPCPSSAPLTSAERRILAPAGGAFDTRAFERDGRAMRSLTWPPMNAQKSRIFYDWWRDDLTRGGAWWTANWALPNGDANADYRFVAPPRKTFLPPYHWIVTAVCEVRPNGAILPLYYTSWPYALFTDEELDIDSAEPIAGQLWVQPLEELDLDRAEPISGTLLLQLHEYNDWPADEVNLDRSTPLSGTLDVVLHTYDQPAEELDADRARPLSGTLFVQLVTYDQPADELDADRAIPLSGTLA